MDTKWKNTAKEKSLWLRTNIWKYRKMILGSLLFCAGAVLGIGIHRFAYDTRVTWSLGILMNAFLMLGSFCILPEALEWRFREWIPQREDFYEEWKKRGRRFQKIILTVLVILVFLCLWYWDYQRNQYRYGGWGWNYARGYLAFATVFLQWIGVEFMTAYFLLGKLNLLMERMNEINAANLRNALEIEKNSLEKVSRSDQLRVDLITNVSHDLKTPLTSMVGYIELLKKENLGDTARDYVEVISGRATKLKEMIESLFSLAKASSGNVELHVETIELNRLIEQIFADMADHIDDSGLEFVRLLTADDTHMETDNTYMYRICQNLLENALKYSAKGTRVFVKTFRDEQTRLCLELTNTAGYKMDFAKEDIVERFARADKARASEGNGLGLAIVSSYTKALGGDFDIILDCDQFKARLLFP